MNDTDEKKTKREPKVSNSSKANIPKNNHLIKSRKLRKNKRKMELHSLEQLITLEK